MSKPPKPTASAQRKRKPRPATSASPPSPAASIANSRLLKLPEQAWWSLSAFLLLLAANPLWLLTHVQTLPLPENSLLSAGQLWDPPLAMLVPLQHIANWPFVLYALLSALVLGTIAFRIGRHLSPAAGVTCLFVLCMANDRGQLLTSALLLAAILSRDRLEHSSITPIHFGWSAIAILGLAIGTSLEFGIVAILLAGQLLSGFLQYNSLLTPRQTWGIGLAWLSLLLLPGTLWEGYFPALLRPLSWSWLHPSETLLPSIAPWWRSPLTGWQDIAVLAIMAIAWWSCLTNRHRSVSTIVMLAFFSFICVGCLHYTYLGAIGLSLLAGHPRSDADALAPSRSHATRDLSLKHLRMGVIGVSSLLFAFQTYAHRTTLLVAGFVHREADPTLWDAEGAVLLTNLDQSPMWRRPEVAQKYQMVLSDRWDVFAPMYPEYEAVCDDWMNWQREAYMRADGSWGGYEPQFARWQPVLVSVDTQNTQAIHQAMLDSQWRVIGIDPQRTIFGSTQTAGTARQAIQASRLFSFLEFPRAEENIELDETIALGTFQDSIEVANAFTAMRMPFAAMRILPPPQHPSQQTTAAKLARALALVELAHRTQRYSGQVSLIDHARAWTRVQALLREPNAMSASERDRLHLSETALASSSITYYRAADANRIPERALRAELSKGNFEAARQLLDNVSLSANASFYRTILDCVQCSTSQLVQQLDETAQRIDLSPDLRDEARFYLGCLAIELGDAPRASQELQRLATAEANSPFRDIAQFYVSQLQAAPRNIAR